MKALYIAHPGTNKEFCTRYLGIDGDKECEAAFGYEGELTNRRAESEMGLGMFIISTNTTSLSLSVRRKLH